MILVAPQDPALERRSKNGDRHESRRALKWSEAFGFRRERDNPRPPRRVRWELGDAQSSRSRD